MFYDSIFAIIKNIKNSNTIDVKIVTHYEQSDTDCSGEYYDIEVFINNRLVAEYGDYYHDKGEEKVEGFIAALKLIYGNDIKIEKQSIADRD